MPKVDLKDIRDKVQDAVDTAKSAVTDVDIDDVKEKILDTGESVLGAVRKIKAQDMYIKKARDTLKKKGIHASGNTDEDDDTYVKPMYLSVISTKSAIKIIYYLMAIDGEIFHNEEEKFDAVCQELDPHFQDHRFQILNECNAQFEKVIDADDYYDTLRDGVDDALNRSRETADTFITPKLLVWNLLTIAYSDESYNDSERRFIKYIVRKTGIDKAVFLEMESSMLTLMDLQDELMWIKTTNKPYLTIEAIVNELTDRMNVIYESVKDLITL